MAKNDIQDEVTLRRYSPTEQDQEVERVLRSTQLEKRGSYKRGNRKGNPLESSAALPSEQSLKAISNMQMANHQDYRAIIELLPEVERGMSILESAILSPKDLLSPKLMYRMREDTVMEYKNEVLTAIQSYLSANYDLNQRLPSLLREALHRKGSYTLAAIPRNTIDALVMEGKERINMQALNDPAYKDGLYTPLGLLALPEEKTAPDVTPTMLHLNDMLPSNITPESFRVAGLTDIEITDNFNLVKLPRIKAANRRTSVAAAVRPRVGIKMGESVNMQSANDEALAQLYKRRDYTAAPAMVLPTGNGSEEVYGKPLEVYWPAEAVIPVHVGGDIKTKVGVILLTDENGEAITGESVESQYRVLQSSLRGETENNQSASIERIREAMGARRAGNISAKIINKELSTSFKDMVTADLVARLSNGTYGPEVGISSADHILDLAFKRMLCERKTRMVFVPEELATYIAFDYDEFGLGRSRLESSKIIASMRAVLLYSNMNAALINASPQQNLVIKLDEDDDDPEGTIEDTIAEFYALNSMRLRPGSTLNSADISKLLQEMGVTISVQGNSSYPDMEVNLEEQGRSKALIERDLDESLAKRIWLMMGLSPEAVDSSFDVEFAKTIVSNNLFLAKLASELQATLLFHYSAHARKLIYSDGNLMTDLITIIQENTKGLSEQDLMDNLNELIESFHLALPSTDMAKIETQQEALENYTSFVEGAIESYVNEEMLDGFVDGELTDAIRPAIRAYRDMMIRDFMRRENILPELQSIADLDGDDLDLGERFKKHADPIMEHMAGLMEHFRKKSREFDEAEEARIAAEEEKRRLEEEEEEEARRLEDEANNPDPDPDDELTDDGLEDESTNPDEESLEDIDTETDPTSEDVPEETEGEVETPTDEDGLDDALGGLGTLDL